MTDRIIYTAIDNGIDGRGPDCIMFATYEESEIDSYIEASPNKHYLRKQKGSIDVAAEIKLACQRVGAIGRLVLAM